MNPFEYESNLNPMLYNYLCSLRLKIILWTLSLLNHMPRRFKLNGYTVTFDSSVSHPRPLPGLSFFPLFKAAASEVSQHHSVLEMGAGAGIWSLMCLEKHAQVSASDLPHVCLNGLLETSQRAGFTLPHLYYGDLFDSIPSQYFDHIFFNPPFHFHSAQHHQLPYCAGEDGDVLNRFMLHIRPFFHKNSVGWLILPTLEFKLWAKICLKKNESFKSPLVSTITPILNINELVEKTFLSFGFKGSLYTTQWVPLLGRLLLIRFTLP